MAKQKKKRTKKYQGADASVSQPAIRVKAVKRSKTGQWWHDNKRKLKTAAIVALVVFVITWLIVELVRIITT